MIFVRDKDTELAETSLFIGEDPVAGDPMAAEPATEAGEQSDQAPFIGYFLCTKIAPTKSKDRLTVEETWANCTGYYVFLKQRPNNLDALATFLRKLKAPAHTGFLWLREEKAKPEKSGEADGFEKIQSIETVVSRTSSGDEAERKTKRNTKRVAITAEVMLDFGGYQLPFGADTPIVYENPDDPSGFIFLVPPDPPNIRPAGAKIPKVDDGVHLTFTGPRRGCFECDCFIGDYYSKEETSWNVGLRYTVGAGEIHQFYPVFDLRDGRRPVLRMCWDLTDQLNPERTYLQFTKKSVKLVATGEGSRRKYRLKRPHRQEILPTHFRTVTGDVIAFVARSDGERPARLVFELWTRHPKPDALDRMETDAKREWSGAIDPPPGARYYLVPSGEFELLLIDARSGKGHDVKPITSKEKSAAFPSRFLCGLSGIESVRFKPRDRLPTRAIGGDRVVFFPRMPAYVPDFPIIRETKSKDEAQGAKAPQDDAHEDEGLENEPQDGGAPQEGDAREALRLMLRLIRRDFMTAWMGLRNPDNKGLAYLCQPEAAPLFKDSKADDRLVTLFEPVAAALPLPALRRSFPVAPARGAAAAENAPRPKHEFIKRLEAEIIAPSRREVIRAFSAAATGSNGVPPDPATPKVTQVECVGATPQGFRATIGAERWDDLLLARRGKDTIFRFMQLDPALQAAFQSGQLFLVASSDRKFRFPPKGGDQDQALPKGRDEDQALVRMSGWEFDLRPEPSSLTDPKLKNVLIIKASPGRLIDRIGDPRSWTNPVAFNTAASGADPSAEELRTLAKNLTDFFKNAVAQSSGASALFYERFAAVIRDEAWAGIIGINVALETKGLPPGLAVLKAGIPDGDLEAHHIVVDAGRLERGKDKDKSLGPADSFPFGLIDFPKRLAQGEGKPAGEETEKPAAAADKPAELKDQPVDFAVTELLALFGNGELTHFSCRAALTLKKLFGETVVPATADGAAATTGVEIGFAGTRESRAGRDSYSLAVIPEDRDKKLVLRGSVIQDVTLRKVEFEVADIAGDANDPGRMVTTFSLWGSMAFVKDENFDVLSYERLAFSGLTIRMTIPKTIPKPTNANERPKLDREKRKFDFDLAGMTLDGTTAATEARPKSLIWGFPMKLQRFLEVPDQPTLTRSGYVAVAASELTGELAKPVYGLEFALNLGTLGSFAASAGITAGLVLAWSPGTKPKSPGTKPESPETKPESPATKAKVFLKLPGVSAASADALSLQGVVRLGADTYALERYVDGTAVSWGLRLSGLALRVLGLSLPLEKAQRPTLFLCGPPPAQSAPDAPLAWYALYRDEPAAAPATGGRGDA